MSNQFNPLFPLTNSSLLFEGPLALAVFSVFMSCADRNGEVNLNPAVLAEAWKMPLEEVWAAIRKLEGPDPRSRTKAHDGRRLIRIGECMWELPSHEKWRGVASAERARELAAERQRRKRARLAGHCEVCDSPAVGEPVNGRRVCTAHAFADDGDAGAAEDDVPF